MRLIDRWDAYLDRLDERDRGAGERPTVQVIAAGVIGGATGLFWEDHPLIVALIWAVVLLVAAVTGHRPVVGWPRALLGLAAALAVLWLWHEYVGPMVD